MDPRRFVTDRCYVPNPFFTVAAEDGTFTIAGIPVGSHELLVWHEEYGTVKSVVEIRAGETTTVEVDLSRTPKTP